MTEITDGHVTPDNPTRRSAMSLIAAATPMLAGATGAAVAGTAAGAASMPSAEFLECKARYAAWLDELYSWPADKPCSPEYDTHVEICDAVMESYGEAFERLCAMPPSQQKLSELLALAVLNCRDVGKDDGFDILSGESEIVAAFAAFEALGQGATNV
jgi:hypothetical protein